MNKEQSEFLRLSVIEKLKYEEIESRMNLDRRIFNPWWDIFKLERKELTIIRDKWQSKCPEIEFDHFKKWYEEADKKCFYCELTENEMKELWERDSQLTKRNRGKKLEIERLEPNIKYSNVSNLVFSCYWCNNAKTDTFTKEEFIKVGKVIKEIWRNRLR